MIVIIIVNQFNTSCKLIIQTISLIHSMPQSPKGIESNQITPKKASGFKFRRDMEQTDLKQVQSNTIHVPNSCQKSQVSPTDSEKQQHKCKLSIKVVVILSVIVGLSLFLTLFLMLYFHSTDTLTFGNQVTYEIPNQDRKISTVSFTFEHNPWIGNSTKVQGQAITLPSSNATLTTPGMIAINNNQAGISLKKLGDSNYIIEVDPNSFFAYYEKNHPIQAKRRLAYLHLTRNLKQDELSFGSQELQQKIIQEICAKTKMDPQTTSFKEMQYHIATNSEQGFLLQRENPTSSRLLQFAESRRLFFYDMYLAYLMSQRTSEMVDAADQVKKAIDKQQKGQQPVTVVTVINIVNNTNVVINLNSSTNVVINNNNNKEVNINKGENEPVIQNGNTVQSNQNKRMLTVQAQQKIEYDEKNIISKAAFQYATFCRDIGGTKHCPAGYFHRPNNPFKLAPSEQENKMTNFKTVKKILIGSRTLLNLDELLQQELNKASKNSPPVVGEGVEKK